MVASRMLLIYSGNFDTGNAKLESTDEISLSSFICFSKIQAPAPAAAIAEFTPNV